MKINAPWQAVLCSPPCAPTGFRKEQQTTNNQQPTTNNQQPTTTTTTTTTKATKATPTTPTPTTTTTTNNNNSSSNNNSPQNTVPASHSRNIPKLWGHFRVQANITEWSLNQPQLEVLSEKRFLMHLGSASTLGSPGSTCTAFRAARARTMASMPQTRTRVLRLFLAASKHSAGAFDRWPCNVGDSAVI